MKILNKLVDYMVFYVIVASIVPLYIFVLVKDFPLQVGFVVGTLVLGWWIFL